MSEPHSANPYQPPLAENAARVKQTLVAYEPRARVPWNGWDVLIVLLQVILWEMVAGAIVRQLFPQVMLADAEPSVRQAQVQMTAGGLASCAACLSGMAILKVRARATWDDLGFSLRRPLYDLLLGIKAFAVIAVPVFGIQYVLVQWYPSEHPLVKMVRDEPGSQTLILATLMAVIVAPLVEEFLFRVVLQGWLEKRESRWRRAGYPLFRGVPRGFGPIVLSSALFALLHWGHGPDPIPLFVLAVALGYVYRQTHRIWPSLIVHACLNGASVGMLWLSLAGM